MRLLPITFVNPVQFWKVEFSNRLTFLRLMVAIFEQYPKVEFASSSRYSEIVKLEEETLKITDKSFKFEHL